MTDFTHFRPTTLGISRVWRAGQEGTATADAFRTLLLLLDKPSPDRRAALAEDVEMRRAMVTLFACGHRPEQLAQTMLGPRAKHPDILDLTLAMQRSLAITVARELASMHIALTNDTEH